MKTIFEPGDIVTLAVTELGEVDYVGQKFTFVSYLQTPFANCRKNNVILDCVVYNPREHILMPAKSQNLKIIRKAMLEL